MTNSNEDEVASKDRSVGKLGDVKLPKLETDWRKHIDSENFDELKQSFAARMQEILDRESLNNYCTLILHDPNNSLSSHDANLLYNAASRSNDSQDILLIIHSNGGRIEPAYLIGKSLKRLSKDKFTVAIPRLAKSAATLISLGADEIHMGHVSELGPIDPQIGGLPVLALGDALESICAMAEKHQGASEMLGKYLVEQVPIRTLGYYRRVSESAIQYAELLLNGKQFPGGKSANYVADRLVNHYKDHGFVIDFEEATALLGDIIKTNTAEYRAADSIYQEIDFLKMLLETKDKGFFYVGAISAGPFIFDSKR
jgi:Serine dehydrogenase proteinase